MNLMETDADYCAKCQFVEEKLKDNTNNLEEK
jgi:hypothetical protein